MSYADVQDPAAIFDRDLQATSTDKFLVAGNETGSNQITPR